MLRESWSGLPAVVRDLAAAFRRLLAAARAVAADAACRLDEAGARQKLNAILAQRNEQLDAALENMLQGLAMFDAGQRLIVCNRRYSEMYGLTADQVRPGTTVREILQHRLANGNYVINDNDSFLDSWTSSFGAVSTRVQELADGRIISVSRQTMASGGRLVTHEDITDLRQAEKAAMEARALAERAASQARVAHTHLLEALDVVPEGIVLFDSDDRYITWNRRYTEMYGHSTIEVGKTFAEILRAGLARGQYPEAVGCEEAWLADRLARHANKQNSHEQRLPNGRWVRVEERRTADGGAIGVRIDITELKRREDELRAQKLQF
jgi:PAS domain S-box-containing protein